MDANMDYKMKRLKIKKGNILKNYGVENPNQCKEIRDKTKETSFKKYGCEYA
jgi:hypothetical protein